MKNFPDRAGQVLLLTKNDIRTRYAGAALGSLWSLFLPLLTILTLWYVYDRGFRNPPVENVPYILWFTSAYLPWIFFSDLLTGGCSCLLDYSFLITKIPFPVHLLPLIRALTALFFHFLFLLLLTAVLVLRGLAGIYLLQLPLYTLLLFFFGLGISLILGILRVWCRDLEALVQGALQILFWASPILWNPDTLAVPGIRRILALNPLSLILEGYRDALLGRGWIWERREAGIRCGSLVLLLWILALFIYRKARPCLADRMQ